MSKNITDSEFKRQRIKINILMNFSMFLTMGISLIIISFANFTGNSNCTLVQVTSKKQVINKYFYSLSNGLNVWSEQDFTIKEQVCLKTPNPNLAQK
jgi:hypothetical protein